MAEERKPHKYEIVGKSSTGREVKTTAVAYNREQLTWIANKANITMGEVKDLGTTVEDITTL